MANPIATYNDLVQAVQEASFDDSAEMISFIPVAINNAELRLTKELDSFGLIAKTSVSVQAGTPINTKPSGCRLIHSVSYRDPTTLRTTILRKKTDDYLAAYWPEPTSVGTPVYYGDIDLTTYVIAPCVSAKAKLTFNYEKRITALTSANQTNYFTDFTADALFYATMIEIGVWMRNAKLTQDYTSLYQEAVQAANNEGRRSRRDDGTDPGNPDSGQNILGKGNS